MDSASFITEQFDQRQIKQLTHHLKNIENYYRFVSLEIRHQEKSIGTLNKSIINTFPEIQNRVQLMISKSKINIDFLNIILQPYKWLLMQALLVEKQKGEEEAMHTHDHSASNHNTILNMFYHMVRQWSAESDIQYIRKIVSLIDMHAPKNMEKINEKQRILIVGSGMGRIVHQVKKHCPESEVQGHQSDTQLYLCGQYFLNRCQQSHQIYPYIHNLCNFMHNSDPYRAISIPAVIDDHSCFYPLTLGNFPSLYKTHNSNWDMVITVFHNYHIENILHHLRLIYKMLKEGGIWIDLSTSNFDCNVIPFTYREYENVLEQSQFKLLHKERQEGFWYGDTKSLMNERRANYYRVMQK